MGQDLRKVISVFIDGVEEIREISGYLFIKNLSKMMPMPKLLENEYLYFTTSGEAIIVYENDIHQLHGWC